MASHLDQEARQAHLWAATAISWHMPDRHAIDPALREFLDEQAANAPDLTTMSDHERVQAARAALPRALGLRDTIPGLPNDVETRNLTLGNGRPGRLYTPAGASEPLPLLVYFHGGGWVAGTLNTHDPFCRLLSEAAGVLILSVDYRQPPEHPFPAALEDALAAVRWAAEHASELGADASRLAIGGDSAGGNLAAAATNALAGASTAPKLCAQLLLYPVIDHPSGKHPSYEENATGYGLTAEGMAWYWRQYAGGADPNNPDASPLRRSTLAALPPTLVTTAEYDVLRDEGRAYVEKLQQAGVMVTHLHAEDMHHDFPVSPATVARFPQSQRTLNEIAGWLRVNLGVPLTGLLTEHH